MSVLDNAFVPEYNVSAATGYATSDDGMQTIIRFVTPEGGQLMLVIPTVQVEAVRGALASAKQQAATKTQVDDGTKTVIIPQTYHTIRTEHFDGVLLAFDKDLASEVMIGLSHETGFNLGQDLRKQNREARKLIVPEKQGLIQ